MNRKILTVALLAGVLLAACGQAAPTQVASTAMPATPAVQQTAPPAAEPTVDFPVSAPGVCAAEALPIPEITSEDWTQGPPDAKVTLLVYSDFQCPYCAQFDPAVDELMAGNPKDFRLVFRHFPLPYHENALPTALAAEAAGKQGKFFEMKTLLFANQAVWSSLTAAELQTWLAEQAAKLGLDAAKFATDLADAALKDKIKASFDTGYAAGVNGTPFFMVNGSHYQGSFDPQSILDYAEYSKGMFKECPPTVIEKGKKYTATLKTEKGDIVIELFPDQAPLTVNSFVFLARQGWYDGVTFHRVIPDFVAQSGDPSGTGAGSPGFAYSNEVTPELRYDQPGRVGMANAGPDTNGSQFFIIFTPQPKLDGSYTIFGQVVSGMDTVEKLTPRNPVQGIELPPGDKILKVEIEEN